MKLIARTPFGDFRRDTNTAYTHVALAYHADGSPVRIVGAAAIAARRRGELAGVPFLARWSTSAEGAVRNAANYGYDRDLSVHGPFAVEAES